MKKQILIPVLLFSSFIGLGMGSLVDSAELETNLFRKVWNTIVEGDGGGSVPNTLDRWRITKETKENFEKIRSEWQKDFDVLIGVQKEDMFIPGIILTSDQNVYEEIETLKRSFGMVKFGVDSIQGGAMESIIRRSETDEAWNEIKDENDGEETTTNLLYEVNEIIRLGKEVCKRQRADIECE